MWAQARLTLTGAEAMSPELRESRAALLLMAVSVFSVLSYGALTFLTQLE
jgi:hypothetical protein